MKGYQPKNKLEAVRRYLTVHCPTADGSVRADMGSASLAHPLEQELSSLAPWHAWNSLPLPQGHV